MVTPPATDGGGATLQRQDTTGEDNRVGDGFGGKRAPFITTFTLSPSPASLFAPAKKFSGITLGGSTVAVPSGGTFSLGAV